MACKDDVERYIQKIQKIKIVKDVIEPGSGKKGVKFNTWAVTDDLLTDLFLSSTTESRIAMEDLFQIITNHNMQNKLKQIPNLKENYLTSKETDAKSLRNRSIAFYHIFNSLASQDDLVRNYGLNKKEIEQISEDGVYKIDARGTAEAIGRNIAYDYGIRATGDAVTNNRIYHKLGMRAINELGGLISVDEGFTINRDYRNEKGESYSREKVIPGTILKINFNELGVDTTKADDKFISYIYGRNKNDITGTEYQFLLNTVKASKFVYRLKVPSNMELSAGDKSNQQKTVHHYVKLTDKRAKTLELMAKSNLEIPEHYMDLFTELNKQITDESGSFGSEYQRIKNNYGAAAFILGITPYERAVDLQDSTFGQTLSKNHPLVDFLDNIESYVASKRKAGFTREEVKNDRQHLIETILNFQTDKYFSRYVISSGKETFNVNDDRSVYNHFVEDVLDVSNELSSEEVITEGTNADLDDLVNKYREIMVEGKDPKQKAEFLTYLAGNKLGLKSFKGFGKANDYVNSFDSVWQLMDSLEGIRAIRDIDENGNITTTKQTRPDAKTSGGSITFTQLAGKDTKVDYLLKQLGILKSDISEEDRLRDMYKILENAIQEKQSQQKSISPLDGNLDEVTKLLDKIKMYKNLRDLSKPMTMVFIYQQKLKGAKQSVGKEMAQKMLSIATQDNIDYIKDILEENHPEVKDMSSIDDILQIEGISDTLATYFADKVVEPLYGLLDQKFNQELLKEDKKFKSLLYSAMTDANKKTGTRILFLPPNAARELGYPTGEKYKQALKDHGIPLMKEYETIEKDTLIKKEFPNETNINVNPQHSLDSAILITAIQNTLARLGYMKNQSNIPGLADVHDSLGSSAKFNAVFQEEYRKAFYELNNDYDINEEMVRAYEAMDGSNPKLVEKFKKQIEGKVQLKQKALKDIELKGDPIFGFENKNHNLPEYINREKQPVQAQAKPKPEPETTEKVKKSKKTEPQGETQRSKYTYYTGYENSVTRERAEQSFNDINEIVNSGKPYVVIDTETAGLTGEKQIPIQISWTVSQKGKPAKEHTIWLPSTLVEENGAGGLDKNGKPKNITKKEHEEALKQYMEENNIEVVLDKNGNIDMKPFIKSIEELYKLLRTTPSIAYNSKFDTDALNMLFKKYLDVSPIPMITDAYAAATLDMENNVRGMKKRTQADASNYYMNIIDVNKLHEASYDVKVLNDVINGIANTSKLTKQFLQKDANLVNLKESDTYAFNPATDTLMVPTDKTDVDMLNHEIAHFYTAAYTLNKSNQGKNEVRYTKRAMNQLLNTDVSEFENYPKLRERISEYVGTINENNPKIAFAEFVAIMISEKDVADEVYAYLEKKNNSSMSNRLKRAIKRIINAIEKMVITREHIADMEANGADPELLAGSINNILLDAKQVRADATAMNNAREAARDAIGEENLYFMKDRSKYEANTNKDITFLIDPLTDLMHIGNEYLSNILVNNIEPIVGFGVSVVASKAHQKMSESSQMYRDTTKYIYKTWDESDLVYQMKHYLNVDGFKQYMDKNKFLSQWQDAQQKRNTADNELVAKFDYMMKDMSKKEVADIDYIYARTPLFFLSATEINQIVKQQKSVDEMIKDIEKRLTKKDHILAKEFADIYIDGNANNSNEFYNSDVTGFTKEKKVNLDKLTTLYSLKKIKNSEQTLINTYKNHNELHRGLVDASRSLKAMNDVVYAGTSDNRSYRGNLIHDVYAIPKEIINVSFRDMKNNKYKEADGWKVLQMPTKEKYGIIYRDIQESSFQEGVGTNVNYIKNDVFMDHDEGYKNVAFNNAISVNSNGKLIHKVVLTDAQKTELGLIRNPAKSLIRSWSTLQMIADTQEIRNEILTKNFHSILDTQEDIDKIEEIAKNHKEDLPWTLKIPSNVLYSDLPKYIKNRYQKASFITRVGKLNQKIDLIRKDIAPWYEGYQEPVMFEHIPILRKTVNVIKQVVKMTKLHQVVTNPEKIMNDAISNTLILTANNIPAGKIIKYGWKANKDLKQLEKWRSEAVALKLRADAGNKAAQKRLDVVLKKINKSPISFALYHGMIQSLSTEIIMKDYDTVFGLQKNIEDVLNKMLLKSDGEKNALSDVIMKFSKWNIRAENVLSYLGDVTSRNQYTRNVSDVLNEMSRDLEKIKSEDDVAKYLSQYIASPDSILVKAGSALTQYTDIIPRIILFQHSIDIGMSEEEAVKLSLESFIDYKVNMPKELKVLSDYGIFMYPAFWMRAQKVIIQLGRKNPMTAIAGLIFQELINVDIPTIIDSNIIEKYSRDQIFNIIDPMLLPEKVFG